MAGAPSQGDRPQSEPEGWRAECAALALRVEELFRAATKQFDPPAQRTCEAIAALLLARRIIAEHDDMPSVWGYEAEREKAEAAARRFLSAIKPIRERLAKAAATAEKHPEMDWATYFAERDRIEAAVRAVEAALPISSRVWAGRIDLPGDLAAMARAGWRRANNRNCPSSTNPDDPLVKFITAALGEAGTAYSPHTVSERLRERAKRKRGAKRKG